MPRTIIIGVDGSERDDDAIALGGLLSRAMDARVLAVSVCDYPALSESGDALARAILEQAEAIAGRAAHRLRDAAEPRAIQSWSPAHGLQKVARAERAELIVVGSSRRGVMGRILAGSTPERLLHDAPCAVAIAPLGYADAPDHALCSIGAGFDGGEEARAALAEAVALARAASARLTLIDVVGILVGPLVQSPAVGVAYVGELDQLRERAQRIAQDAVADVTEVEVSIETPTGDAGIELAQRSSDLDLLVVGSHAYGALRRLLSGSVSTRLARSTACPLVVLPHGVAQPGADAIAASAAAEER